MRGRAHCSPTRNASTSGSESGSGVRVWRQGLESGEVGHRVIIGDTVSSTSVRPARTKGTNTMEYGIGGILILILVILAIIYFAKRV